MQATLDLPLKGVPSHPSLHLFPAGTAKNSTSHPCCHADNHSVPSRRTLFSSQVDIPMQLCLCHDHPLDTTVHRLRSLRRVVPFVSSTRASVVIFTYAMSLVKGPHEDHMSHSWLLPNDWNGVGCYPQQSELYDLGSSLIRSTALSMA